MFQESQTAQAAPASSAKLDNVIFTPKNEKLLEQKKKSLMEEFSLPDRAKLFFLIEKNNGVSSPLVESINSGTITIIHAALKYGYQFFDTSPAVIGAPAGQRVKWIEGYVPVELIYEQGQENVVRFGTNPQKEMPVSQLKGLNKRAKEEILQHQLTAPGAVSAKILRHLGNNNCSDNKVQFCIQ